MLLPLDRALSSPLQAQLFEQLRELIHSGRLPPMTRMPATRGLALQMRVSRTTVMLVYEELIAEGYLQTKPAAGTFVSDRPPGAPSRLGGSQPPAQARPAAKETSRVALHLAGAAPTFDFRPDGFDRRLFPIKTWQRLVSRVLRDNPADLADDHASGLDRLRAAVASWMTVERGIATSAEEVIIVSGCRQAHHILARLLLGDGKLAVVDTPFPRAAAAAFESVGARVLRLPEMGLGPASRPLEGHDRPALIWLNVPHHHAAPETGLRWWQRRQMLVDWAGRTGAPLVEFEGVDHALSLAPPAARDSKERLIRLGNFSPTLGPGVRLGYMIVPRGLVERAISLKASLAMGHSWLEQSALARFIEDGGYTRHLRRICKILLERRAALIEGLRLRFPATMLEESTAEDHVSWVLPADFPVASTIRDQARARGIELDTGEDGFNRTVNDGRQALDLSYARMNVQQISAGLAKLAAIIDGCSPCRPRSVASA